MEKIIKPAFGNCKNILYSDSPSYSGILAGECKGDVWVDNIDEPKLALVYSAAVGGFSIMGNPDDLSVYDNLIDFLKEELFPKFKKNGTNSFEFSFECEESKEYILNKFSNEDICKEDEYFYRKNESVEVMDVNPYKVVQVNSEFIKDLKSGKYDNPEFLSEKILESWDNFESFLNRSVAFVTILDSTITAAIVGTARYHNIIPVDIETIKEHRKKGLASAITQNFINECIKRELIIQWNCVETNTASRKSVEKAGFTLIKKEPFYWFEI